MEITIEDYVESHANEFAQTVDLGNDFLDHHGVKGQRWGVRRRKKVIARQQKGINRLRRIEVGKGSHTDRWIAGWFQVPLIDLAIGKGLRGGSHRVLERQRKNKAKILAGHRKINDILNRSLGFNVRDVTFAPLK